jgi:hypothetical protein
MNDLPIPIRDFILSLTDDMLSPAYLLVTEDGQLIVFGGDLNSYGLNGLTQGVNVTDIVPFLFSVLPIEGKSLYLPNVQTKAGVFANVYVFTREQGTWVLLLDATVETSRKQKMQQRLYDSRLQVSELERESTSLHEANAVLERLVSERTADLSQTILQLRQQLDKIERARKAGLK